MDELNELNFSESAQAHFDALVNDGADSWSWAGLAAALSAKFGRGDLEAFQAELAAEIQKLPE